MKYFASALFLAIWAFMLHYYNGETGFIRTCPTYDTTTSPYAGYVPGAYLLIPLAMSVYLFISAEIERSRRQR